MAKTKNQRLGIVTGVASAALKLTAENRNRRPAYQSIGLKVISIWRRLINRWHQEKNENGYRNRNR